MQPMQLRVFTGRLFEDSHLKTNFDGIDTNATNASFKFVDNQLGSPTDLLLEVSCTTVAPVAQQQVNWGT